MKTLEEQVHECIRRFALNEDGIKDVQLPYLYVTQINNSLNPACCKVGCSGRDDEKGSENINKKLKRYNTAVPDNWELYVMVVLKCDSDELYDYEKMLMDCIETYGRRCNSRHKELFAVSGPKYIDAAVKDFIMDVQKLGSIKDICGCYFEKDQKYYKRKEILKIINKQQKKTNQSHRHMLTEGKHWPADYIKTGINMVKASQLGKQPWYTDQFIQQDMKTIADEFEPLSHKNSNLGFFSTIVRWFIEYSRTSKQKYQEFIELKLDSIIRSLQVVCNDPAYDKIRDQIKQKWIFDQFEELQARIEDSQRTSSDEKMQSIVEKNDYDVIPIYSYEELNEQFGGRWTGYRGQSEWCHTNGKSTYSSWTKGGTQMFFVLAKKDWKSIFQPEEKPTGKDYNAYDEYGMSLIAVLVDVKTGKLLNETLRWNHVIEPSHTNLGASVDHAFKDNWGDLCQAIGMDVKSVCENEIKGVKDKLEKESQNANAEAKKILKIVNVIDKYTIPLQLKSKISSIRIPDNVMSIGYGAFYGCSGLTNVTIPNSVRSIGSSAFADCSKLMSVMIDNGVTSIGYLAFYGCSGLTSVTIPTSVTSIGYKTFYNCQRLKSLMFKGKTLEEVKSMKDYPWGIEDESVIKAEKSMNESRHDPMVHYWAHMLDECFGK